jgi:SMODS and SLOG-associating 2TM effector domain family 5
MQTLADTDAVGKSFYSKLWSTRGARFVARARLRAMNVLSVTTVATLSVYVIALSIVGILFQRDLSDLGQSMINAINICLSVGILAFSLIETSRTHLVESEAMNACALDIGKIYDRFLIDFQSSALTLDVLRHYAAEYSVVLDRCGSNHAEIDYLKFQAEHPNDFGLASVLGWARCRWIEFRYWAAVCWLYVLAIIIPPAAAGALFWKWGAWLFAAHLSAS